MSLVADVFDVLLVEPDDGSIICTTTLQDANIDVRVNSTDVRGGKGNQLIGVLHSGRDIDIALTDVTFRFDWLAKQFGQDIITGAAIAWAFPKWYTATGDTTTGITITLDETPLATNSGIQIYKADGTLISATDYTISDKTVTFTTGVVSGDKVEVRGYKYTTAATANTIEINNKIFADGKICILETLEIENDETPLAKIQYQFDSAVPTGNVTINTTAERKAVAPQFGLRVLKPETSDVVGRIIRVPLA
jgi:hypothetical protein